MALFKVFKGNSANLPEEKHDGYCYFTMDDGIFYIDYLDTDGVTLKRKPISGPGKSIEYIVGTQSAATNVWLGATKDEALYIGKVIAYKLPVAGTSTAATLTLTLANGTTTAAIPVKRKGTGSTTTHYSVGEVLFMAYDGTNWQVNADYDSNTEQYIRRAYSCIKAGSNKIYPYNFILQLPDGRWESLVNSNTTNTNKTCNTHGFLLENVYLHYYDNTGYGENETVGNSRIYTAYANLIDHRYSFNTANNSINGTVANKPVYLVGSLHSDGLFYLDTTKWWTQTLPNTEDGKLYIYLGDAYDYYRMVFAENNPIYKYVNGKVQLWTQYAESTKQTVSLTNPNKLIQTATDNGDTVLKTIENSYVDYATGKITLGANTPQANNETLYVCGSVAEGADTEANNCSHAEGDCTKALGDFSHAEGDSTEALGDFSHAEGDSTRAIGVASHAEGDSTRAIGDYSHAEGFGDGAYQSNFQANIQGTTITGTGPNVNKIFQTGEVIQYNNNLRCVIGIGSSNKQGILDRPFSLSALNNVTCTTYTDFTIAIGEASHAEGHYTTASGYGSHTEGDGTVAFGQGSHAEGLASITYGDYSHAEGQETNTVGYSSHVEGRGEERIITEAQVENSERFEYNLGSSISTDINLIPNKAVVEYNGEYYTIIDIIDRRTIRLDRLIENDQLFWDRIFIYTNGTFGEYSHAEGYKTISDGYQSHSEGKISRASGYSSHAEGGYTWAFGENSHAQGHSTKAFGHRTHAEGNKTVAAAGNAHAEGAANEAQAPNAHAEGNRTKAGGKDDRGKPYGQSSHAEGELTRAFGDFSHAEGYRTKVPKGAKGAHTEGRYSYASGTGAHAEGSSAALGEYSHAEGGAYCISSMDEDGIYTCVLSKEPNDNMCTWIDHAEDVPSVYLKVGQVISCKGLTGVIESIIDDDFEIEISGDLEEISLNNDFIYILPTASGNQSHAEGLRTMASGYYSHAEGHGTHTEGYSSHAEGYETHTEGNSSHAEGYETYTEGNSSHAEGYETYTEGNSSHAEGDHTEALGGSSHAEGYFTIAASAYSHAEGHYTTASGNQSHAEGNYTQAMGPSSHAEGNGTITFGLGSHAEGMTDGGYTIPFQANINGTNITGATGTNITFNVGEIVEYRGNVRYIVSTTQGGSTGILNSSFLDSNSNLTGRCTKYADYTMAIHEASHAEGYNTIAYGYSSHTEGEGTRAYGGNSHAEGSSTIANTKSQHVFGEYNIADTQGTFETRGQYVEIVGNGAYSARSNARTLDWNGNEVLAGKLTIGANPTAAMDVVTKQYLENNTSDTKVKQTVKADNVDYKLLTTVSAAPTSGAAAEAGYGANLAYNPSTNTLKTGNASLTGALNVTGQTTLNDNLNAQGITATNLMVTGNSNFVQIPTAPTPDAASNDTSVATTAFVKNSVAGLSGAMHFRGTTTSAIVDGSTTNPVSINGSNYTAVAGDVVLREISSGNIFEYVWTGSAWEMLGRDTSFKVQQTAVSSPTASGSTTAFIDTISQDANGNITVTKKNLDTSGTWSGTAAKATQDGSGNNIVNTYLTKAAGVTNVAWDNTNKKLTKTINGTISDVVTITVNNPTLAWNTESIIAKIGTVDVKVKLPDNPNVNTDTLVKQTAKTDSVEYKILATTSASPTSGNAAEAAYGADFTINPSAKTITSPNYKVTSNATITYNTTNGCLEIIV